MEIRSSSVDARGRAVLRPVVHISVPKKIIRLATDRNRVKRLLRESLRGSGFFKAARLYTLKVKANPLPVTLPAAKAALERAASEAKLS